MIKNICTVSDYNYLFKGLCLYDSLKEHSNNFLLHYLCIDDKTYEILKKIETENLKVYHIDELLQKDIILQNLKNTNYSYFCWSLASYFCNFLLQNFDSIMYIDSDILLHDNIDIIYNEIGIREICIFRHRQFALNTYRPEGLYNVGIVYFKNSNIGRDILNWWSDAVLHKKYPYLATCGDQKYLENFEHMCPTDLILIDGNIGHGAPWQWQLYDYSDFEQNGNIIWNGKKQKLIFTHFSQFQIAENGYIPSTMHHIYTPFNAYIETPALKKIYDEYYNKLKNTIKKYGP